MEFFIHYTKIVEHIEAKLVKLDTDNLRRAFPDLSDMSDKDIIDRIKMHKGGLNCYNPTDEDFYKDFDDTCEEADYLVTHTSRYAEDKDEIQVFCEPEEWDYSVWEHDNDEIHVTSRNKNEAHEARIARIKELETHNIETP